LLYQQSFVDISLKINKDWYYGYATVLKIILHLRESDSIDHNKFSKIIQSDQNYYIYGNNPILAAIKCFQVQLHVKGMKEILNNVLQHNKYSHNHDVCQTMRSGIFYNLPVFSFIHSVL